jgi:NhaP-type Na+/H+ or K+/H+ antiporter
MYWVWWLGWRIVVSLACAFSIQNLAQKNQGIYIHTEPLLITMACLIILIQMWSASGHYEDKK